MPQASNNLHLENDKPSHPQGRDFFISSYGFGMGRGRRLQLQKRQPYHVRSST